jgi:hypothetical protein
MYVNCKLPYFSNNNVYGRLISRKLGDRKEFNHLESLIITKPLVSIANTLKIQIAKEYPCLYYLIGRIMFNINKRSLCIIYTARHTLLSTPFIQTGGYTQPSNISISLLKQYALAYARNTLLLHWRIIYIFSLYYSIPGHAKIMRSIGILASASIDRVNFHAFIQISVVYSGLMGDTVIARSIGQLQANLNVTWDILIPLHGLKSIIKIKDTKLRYILILLVFNAVIVNITLLYATLRRYLSTLLLPYSKTISSSWENIYWDVISAFTITFNYDQANRITNR